MSSTTSFRGWKRPVLTLILSGWAAAGLAQPPTVLIDPVNETDAVHAGTTARVGLDVVLDPGYHVNSEAPLDDLLIPTVLRLDPPEGFTLEGVAFPEAILLDQVGVDEPLAVFEEEFTIGAALRVDASLAPGDYTVPGTLRYQACNDRMCFNPTNAPVQFALTVAPDSQPVATVRADLFAGLEMADPGGDAPVPAAPAGTAPILDDLSVMAALEDFEVLGSTGGYLGTEAFLDFMAASESGEGGGGWFEGRGPLAILLLILVGGLALNLTPCVLPMIPINLAIIGAGAKAGSRLRGFALGGAYGAAMALVYGGLGLVVILTAGSFGTINSSPWFNVGIAALFVVLGLAMFDVLAIDFSRLQSRFAGGGGRAGSFLVAFGMGAVAALLAGACVAPGGHPGHRVLEQPLRHRHDDRPRAAVRSRHRDGPAVARRGGGAVVDAEAGGVDGPRQARLRGVHPRHRGVLRLHRLRAVRAALGRSGRGREQRAGAAGGGLARLARPGPRHGEGRGQAGARRHVGHMVQELPHHGPHHPQGPRGRSRARRLREGEVPGRGPRRLARRGTC